MLTPEQFFAPAKDDYCIAPNLEPHPPLRSFPEALNQIEQQNDGTKVFLDICDEEDGQPIANAVVVLTPRPQNDFESFARSIGTDGIREADEKTARRIGQVPMGFKVWRILWDGKLPLIPTQSSRAACS